MKKLIFTTAMSVMLFMGFTKLSAQPCDIKPDDLPELKNRILIVDFQGDSLRDWLLENWKLNKKIEFKTQKECLNIPKDQREKYLVLGNYYEEMHYQGSEFGKPKRMHSSHRLSMIGLIRLEDYKKVLSSNNPDNVVIATYTPEFEKDKNLKERLANEFRIENHTGYEFEPERLYNTAEIKLCIKILLNQLSVIEKDKKKKYDTRDLSKDQSEENCKNIASKDVYIDKRFIKEPADVADFKRNKKFTVYVVSSEEIESKILNEEDVLIAYNSPFGIQGANDILLFTHFLVNAKDGVYYYQSGRGQFTMPGAYFRKAVFKEIMDCAK
ncbi:MAG: hypothetical protein NTZ33_06580 [Bacteroidetes bacterium]|nr:hypothetical protein [Bacteroidota bacterium]